MEAFDAGVVEANVVRGPPSAERVAPRRELADEVREATVVRVPAGFRAQDRDGVGRNLFPVDVEVGRTRVEEDEARRVCRPVRAVEMLRVEGTTESVGGEDVHASVAHKPGRSRDRVEHALHAGPNPLPRRPTTCSGHRVRTAREVKEVRALGLVELERTSKCLQNGLRNAARVAALEARVIVDADPREERDLLPAEPWNPPLVAVPRQARLLGRDLGSPGGQKLADLVPVVHRTRVAPPLYA